ncbi:MAG: hypothetical protein ACE366_08725 [Bradymonadia bacterium]
MSEYPEGTGPGTLHQQIVDRIMEEMDDRAWSVSELARRCGGYPKAPQLSDALSGKRNRTLNFKMIESIAVAFDLPPVDLVLVDADTPTESVEISPRPQTQPSAGFSDEAATIARLFDALGQDKRALIKWLIDQI